MSEEKFPIKWNNADFKWNTAPPSEGYKPGFKPSKIPYTWNDVALIKAAAGGGGDLIDDMPWQKWEDEKKKRLIKLICKVKGKTYKESKYVNDYKIKVNDVRLVAKEILGIEIMTENIKF
jgi:hypothetical protein